jgi:hypothetical protein
MRNKILIFQSTQDQMAKRDRIYLLKRLQGRTESPKNFFFFHKNLIATISC